ncbi:MAG: lipase family protein [Terriglobales bacterium]
MMGRPLVNPEAVFYGKFVNAAYAMFKRDPANLKPEPQPGDIPDPYELVAWIDMTDFFLDDKERRFYGFIAQSKNADQEFILAIRGTEGKVEWWDDATACLVPFKPVHSAGHVHEGFDKIYSSMRIERRRGAGEDLHAVAAETPFTGSFADQLEQLHKRVEGARKTPANQAKGRPDRTYVVTGHSLGSALCTLFVIENKEKGKFDVNMLCTFASPRVGNTKFARLFDQLPITSWRIVNTRDVVPKVPLWIPFFFNYHHVNTAYKFSSAGSVKWSLACQHSMSTYLHWLDPNIAVDPECQP